MGNQKKLSTGAVVGIIVLALLTVAGLVCNIIGSIQFYGYLKITPGFVSRVIMLIATIYYASVGYKRPHGNLLRVIFLLLSLTYLNGVIDSAQDMTSFEGNDLNLLLLIIGLNGICVLLVAYVGGRLDKIKKNYFPLILITAAQVVKSLLCIPVFDTFSAYSGLSILVHLMYNFSTCILWLDIAFAYVLRYKAHTEAGLIDKE